LLPLLLRCSVTMMAGNIDVCCITEFVGDVCINAGNASTCVVLALLLLLVVAVVVVVVVVVLMVVIITMVMPPPLPIPTKAIPSPPPSPPSLSYYVSNQSLSVGQCVPPLHLCNI